MKFKQSATLHWGLQRFTALLLLPLTIIFLQFIHAILIAPYQIIIEWIKIPFHTSCLIAWFIIVCYHTVLGLQVVIEDYIANPILQNKAIILIKIIFGLLASIAMLLLLTLSVR
jgi:succinate dehydrogenase / fumarate reductase membrane anchor subunit